MIRAGKIIILLIWLAALTWLIRFEAFPELFSGSILTYRNLIGQDILLRESWHKVSLKGKDIGYVSISIASEDASQKVSYNITSKTHINLGLPVRTDDIVLETSVRLDSAYNLLSMESDLQAPGVNQRNIIERIEHEKFKATTYLSDTGEGRERELSLPDSIVVFLPPNGLLPQRLREGVRSYIRVIDPISLKTSFIELETVTKEQGASLSLARKFHWTRLNHKGMDFFCARNSSDEIVWVKAPIGITLTKCDADEALAAAGMGRNNAPALDIDPDKVAEYVESLIGPLSNVITIKPKDRKDHD